MAEPRLGAWEVDVPKQLKKKKILCDECPEAFLAGELRCTWFLLDRDEGDPPSRAFHLRCIPQAAKQGLCCSISLQNVRATRALSKVQLVEFRTAQGVDMQSPPQKESQASVEDGASLEKVTKDGEQVVPSVNVDNNGKKKSSQDGDQMPNKKIKKGVDMDASAEKQDDQMQPTPQKESQASVEDCASPEKVAKDGEQDVKAAEDKTGILLPESDEGSYLLGPGGKHVQGIVPASTYIPIKDFVKSVVPNGTAQEVFENEVSAAFPSVAKWVPWLSHEAQKVATSIITAERHGKLSPQQVYAVVLYTLDVRHTGGKLEENFYYNLNPSLQTRSMDVLQRIEGYLHHFMGALEALPKEEDKVYYRGVPKSTFDVIKKNYTSGKRIHWSGITSISDSDKVSMQFAMSEGPAKGEEGPVVFNISARSGRTIKHLSALPHEAEVLLLPNFRGFVSKGVYWDKKTKVFRVDIVEEAETEKFVF